MSDCLRCGAPAPLGRTLCALCIRDDMSGVSDLSARLADTERKLDSQALRRFQAEERLGRAIRWARAWRAAAKEWRTRAIYNASDESLIERSASYLDEARRDKEAYRERLEEAETLFRRVEDLLCSAAPLAWAKGQLQDHAHAWERITIPILIRIRAFLEGSGK